MEKLIIHNFLTIRSAEIEVRRFNLFIGPQASGKSIIVKLLYFFKAEFGNAFKETIRKMQGRDKLEDALKEKFETIFPRRYWNTQEFSIEYRCGELTLSVKTEKGSSGEYNWSITCSEGAYELQSTLKEKYKASLEPNTQQYGNLSFLYIDFFGFTYSLIIAQSIYSQNFEDQIFIPANRTFFTSLQKNIFSILSGKIDIDYFLKVFGSTYEQTKRFLEFIAEENSLWEYEDTLEIMAEIIRGRYVDEEGEDWIVNNNGKINLAHASSGQQESLPMLLVLSVLPLADKGIRSGFFIEEPEAHLFPVSQKAVISLLALITNKTQHQFFITTHSPYLLTALNNCIIAHETYAAADEAGKQKVLEIMPQHQHIDFADVAAWTVTEKGTIESILDQEGQFIGASILDGVSQHFETVTNELLDIRYDGQSL